MCESIGHQPLWGCCPKVISFVCTTALVVLVWSNTGLKWPFVNHLHYQWFLNEVCALFFFCKIKTLTKRWCMAKALISGCLSLCVWQCMLSILRIFVACYMILKATLWSVGPSVCQFRLFVCHNLLFFQFFHTFEHKRILWEVETAYSKVILKIPVCLSVQSFMKMPKHATWVQWPCYSYSRLNLWSL